MTSNRCRISREPALQLTITLVFILAIAMARTAAAGPPDPALSSIPHDILLVGTQSGIADPAGIFTVHVVDASSVNLAGVTVTVNLTGAPDVELSWVQPVATFISCTKASVVTDAAGIAQFILVGRVVNQTGTWATTSTATITAGTTLLGTTRVAAFDLDGINGVTVNDLHMMYGPFGEATNPPIMDYDGFGGLGANDFSRMLTDLTSDRSSDPQATCAGTYPPSGKITLTAAMFLLPTTDCLSGAATSYCAGTHTDFRIKIACPLCTFEKVTGLEAGLTLSSPSGGGALPAFWRFDFTGCHSGGLQLMQTTSTGTGCLDNSPLYLDTGDGTTLATAGGVTATYPNPATGFSYEEDLRLVQPLLPAPYNGAGIPGSGGPCVFGYGTLPKFPPSPFVPAFALRIRNNNAPTCGACAAVIKIKLNWVKLTKAQPADWSNYAPQSSCPAPQPRPNAAFDTRPESVAWTSSDTSDANMIIILPDGSGSNEITLGDTTAGVALELTKRGGAWLAPAVPNPTLDAVSISFGLPRAEWVRLMIVDVSGRIVRTLQSGEMDPGVHRVTWDGRDQNGERARAGVYFCRLRIEGGPLSSMIVLNR